VRRKIRTSFHLCFFIIGSVTVLACITGGYLAGGGIWACLWQGRRAADHPRLGAWRVHYRERKPVLVTTGKAFGNLLKARNNDKKAYLDLL